MSLTLAALAAGEPAPAEVANALGPASGLAIHIGASDGSLATAWAGSGPVVALAVTGDAAGEERVRAALVAAGVHGQATAALAGGGRVPVIDGSAAQVVADLDAVPSVTREEALRVLRPFGKAWIRSKGAWAVVEKPRDPRMDDWPQYHRDGAASDASRDQLVGPAASLQWTSGPTPYTSDGVRVQGAVLVMEDGVPGGPKNAGLIARDAFSGLPLWRRPDLEIATRFTLMLDSERVYLHPLQNGVPAPAMVALDLRSGRTLHAFDKGLVLPSPPAGRDGGEVRKRLDGEQDYLQARLDGGLLLQIARRELVVLDAATGAPKWRQQSRDGAVWCHPILIDGSLYIVEGAPAPSYSYTHWPAVVADTIHAFDARTGAKRWTWTRPAGLPAMAAYTMSLGAGHLALACRVPVQGKGAGWVLILDAGNGTQVFASEDNPRTRRTNWGLGGGHSGFRAAYVGDRLWLSAIAELWGSMPANGGTPPDWALTYKGMERPVGCTVFRFTPTLALGSLTTYALDGSGVQHTDAARTACDVGAFPANGLTYITPNHCFCQPYIPGSAAFRPQRFAGQERIERLETGPARPAAARPDANAWRMLMAGNDRGSWTEDRLQGELKPLWQVQPAGAKPSQPDPLLAPIWQAHWYAHGPVTQASAAEGIVAVALSHRHVVVAYDAASGRELWRSPVEGRVDSAPTIAGGLVLCGTRDGWVYALNRDDGRLVWRFLAAPRRELLVADGQLESPWPVLGSVNATDEGVWAVAGRHTDADGGMWWWRLDTATGKPLADGRIGSDQLKERTYGSAGPGAGGKVPTGAPSPPVIDRGLFLLTGLRLRLEGGRLLPWQRAAGADKLGEAGLWSEAYELGTLVPGRQGLLAPGAYISAYKMPAYAMTQARMYALRGDDFIMVGGAPVVTHRGGPGGSIVRRMQRLPAIQSVEVTDDKGKKKTERSGAREIWQQYKGDRGSANITAVAVAGDRVLLGRGAERDRRIAPPYKLAVLDFADGKVVQELDLPEAPITAGISSDDGRVFVVTADGTLSAFAGSR